jgi:hypothetical protein
MTRENPVDRFRRFTGSAGSVAQEATEAAEESRFLLFTEACRARGLRHSYRRTQSQQSYFRVPVLLLDSGS